LIRHGLEITDESGLVRDRRQGAAAEAKRDDVLEEHRAHVARAADGVGRVRLGDQRPQRTGAPVHGEQPGNRVRAELEVLVADEQERRHLSRRR